MTETKIKLQEVSEEQNSIATKDAWMAAFLIIPASYAKGDKSPDVGRAKGEIIAIETVQIQKECK